MILGIEALNAYGGHGVETPHLDQTGKQGDVASPIALPIRPAHHRRAELMTGTYPRFTGIQHVLSQVGG